MTRDERDNLYFEWLTDIVSDKRIDKDVQFNKLLMHLHKTDFVVVIPRDQNRATDGIDLRYRWHEKNDVVWDAKPCSVLEMMIGLAIRCEETIMDDPSYGDRTAHWFWVMIRNLGLGGMYDKLYNRIYVDEVIKRLLYREYDFDGKGGLFRVRGIDRDMRDVEIWHQLCWYLDSII